MINLAGVKANEIIIKEMDEAGIEPVCIGRREGAEVLTEYIGKCKNFIFTRAKDYWIVTGYMPLRYAMEIHENCRKLSVLVAGHLGNPYPEEWCESTEYAKVSDKLFNKYINEEMTYEEYKKEAYRVKKNGEQFVTHYHIHTQEGLNKFIDTVKKYNIIG